MGRKPKISKEEKIKVCKDYLDGKRSMAQIAQTLNTHREVIRRWINKYKEYGYSVFNNKSRNSSYTADFKLQVVNEYILGLGSLVDISNKYNIHDGLVFSWVKIYNNGKELKDYDPKGDVYTMKSRKTTIEEKLEIIKYAIDNNHDYKGTADKYKVPYANVFSWVKKYEANQEYGLSDKRGRPSILSLESKKLTELEKVQLELEKEKQKTARLERAVEALKKNEEIRKQLAKRTLK